MEWQPIETAPNDRVLVYNPQDPEFGGEKGRVYEAFVHREGKENPYIIASDPRYSEWDDDGATHWMPLPKPPAL